MINTSEISILRFFHSLWKKKAIIISISFAFVCFGVVFSFLLPKKFDSTATWIPNNESNESGLSGLAAIAGLSLGSSQNNENQLLPSLLQSDSILNTLQNTKLSHSNFPDGISLISYLELDEQLKELPPIAIPPFLREKLQKFIEKNVDLSVSSLISLTVTTKDPLFSKALNEFLVEQMIALNSKIKTLKVSQKRKFLEEQYFSYADSLERTEDELLQFSKTNLQTSSPTLTLMRSRLMRRTETFNSIALEMRKQLEIARLEEKKQSDQIIFITKPTFALKPISPNKKLIVIAFTLLGILIGLTVAIFRIWWLENGREELFFLTHQ